ncbi:histidinol-phosphatase HisJ family protein [Candidatus Bathyarchaeota archaeon]|nr:histidinol-phosphatase HisJ family protein [Candidatus Bathyarchaeota archaeon]MBS7627218.1 histidinol-phosphatase HisJ family protein [Candidatus Bathyarchaeota archaeon]
MIDYHIHTSMCGHAHGEPIDYIKEAISKGFKEVGFSDHIILHVDRREYSMPLDKVADYVEKIEEVKSISSSLGCQVRLGAEVDYSDGKVEEIRILLGKYPFDYVLGSVHSLGDWFFDDPRYAYRYTEVDLESLYRDYFKALSKSIESRLFDVMAHPDLVKKFGFKPKVDLKSFYAEAVEALRKNHLCIEVNTSGLRKPVQEIYPSKDFLIMCHRAGVPVTLGSDAHSPMEVGMDFDKALALLKDVGYEEIVLFSKRKKSFLKISELELPRAR